MEHLRLTDLLEVEQLTSLNLVIPAESTVFSSNVEIIRIESKITFNPFFMMFAKIVQNGKRSQLKFGDIFCACDLCLDNLGINVSGSIFYRCCCNYFN